MSDQDYIVALFGDDKAGGLAAIAQKVSEIRGNLGICRSLRMRGRHGLMLEVTAPVTRIELRAALRPVATEFKLRLDVQKAISDHHGRQYDFCISGEERKGFVASVSDVLARHKLNISALDAGVVGERTYLMRVRVDLPESIPWVSIEPALRSELVEVAAEMGPAQPPAASLIGSIARIRDVRLKESFFHRQNELDDLSSQSYRTGYFSSSERLGQTVLCVEVGFGLLRDEDDERSIPGALKASAIFELKYDVPRLESYQDEELQAFADTNVVITALPYWRQLVQSMLPSMGVHKLVIPAFPMPSAALLAARLA